MSNKIQSLYQGDQRCQTLLDALEETLYERGGGLPVPAVLGVIELLKYTVITQEIEETNR